MLDEAGQRSKLVGMLIITIVRIAQYSLYNSFEQARIVGRLLMLVSKCAQNCQS